MDILVEYLGDLVLDAFVVSPRRIRVSIKRETIREVTTKILKLSSHLSTITVVDCKDGIVELHYHFSILKNNLRTLKPLIRDEPTPLLESETLLVTVIAALPPNDLEIESIARIIPGAQFYEREIREMFGIHVRGILSSEFLLLADDFPQNTYPLRTSTSLDDLINEHERARERLQTELEKNRKEKNADYSLMSTDLISTSQ